MPLSDWLSIIGATLEEFERLWFRSGSKELVSEETNGTILDINTVSQDYNLI